MSVELAVVAVAPPTIRFHCATVVTTTAVFAISCGCSDSIKLSVAEEIKDELMLSC